MIGFRYLRIMLKEKEYLGFAMLRPDQGVVVHVFDFDKEGVSQYGPFKMSFQDKEPLPPEEADILILWFEDGTMPITLQEFAERINSGETWVNEQYNIFTRVNHIGSTYLLDTESGEKLELNAILERDGEDFYIDMFEQCINCLERLNGKQNKPRPKTKAEKLFDKKLPNIANDFPDEGIYELHRNTIVEMIDEAMNVPSPELLDLILQQERELTKKRVAISKRKGEIMKTIKKRHREEKKLRNKKG